MSFIEAVVEGPEVIDEEGIGVFTQELIRVKVPLTGDGGKYANKIYPLTKDEYEALKQSLKDYGYLPQFPIVINRQGDVLDGHHRLKLCAELHKTPTFQIKEFENELKEELFVIDTNLARRQLNDYQRGEILLSKKKPILEKIAKQNMSLAGKGVKGFTPLGRVNAVIANEFGRSHMQLHKIETIMTKAPEEIKEQVRRGKSINQAYQQTQRLEDRDKPKPSLPQEEYDVLYIDPPWKYELGALRGGPENHYAVMTNEEIIEKGVPAAKNAVLFLWVTYPKTREAFDIIDAWGFEFKSEMIWIKDKIGTGYYFRGQHEKLYFCVKGDGLGVPAEADRPPSVLFAPRTEHSRKPSEVYDMIEKMFPRRKYIEMYARGSEHDERKGWKRWGLEATTTG